MIARRTLGFGAAFLLLGLAAAFAGERLSGPRKDKPTPGDKSTKSDVNDLSMEVDALLAVRRFQLDRGQIEALGKLAHETAPKEEKREPARASDAYRKALLDLRDALAADDDDQIDELTTAHDAVYEKENPDLDDEIHLTDAARKKAPDYLTRLSAKQVAAYLAALDDDDLDGPAERLIAALNDSRKLTGEDWDDARDAAAAAAGWLVAGLEAEASARGRDEAKELLDGAHKLTDAEYKARREDLDRSARSLVGDVHPMETIRRIVEHAVAELLSNPRTEAAVAGRLKAAR